MRNSWFLIIFTVLSEQTYIEIWNSEDFRMATIYGSHVIIPINTSSYDAALVTRLADIYPNNVPYSITMMGTNTKQIIPFLANRERICTLTDITAPHFNYAYSINRVVKHLLVKKILKDNVQLVLTDCWNVFSMRQMEAIFPNYDFKDMFLTIDIYQDTSPEILDLNKSKIMLSCMAL